MSTPVVGLVQGIVTSKEYLGIYLDALDDHQSFRLKSSKECGKNDDMEQSISALLMKPDSRVLGLKLLNRYLDQCSIEVLEQKGNLWTNLTIKACNSRELWNAEQIYDTLRKLAEKNEASSELTKSFCNNYLPKIYEALVLIPPTGYIAALRCVETCLRLYPGPSGTSRSVIEKFLARFIDNTNEEISYFCGKCRHLLLQVRGGGSLGVTHKSQWHGYQINLLASLHAVLDQIFANSTELSEQIITNVGEQLNAPELELSNEPVLRSAQLYVRFRNLVNYLVTALEDPFPTEKQIIPMRILRLISRGLSMTCPLMIRNPISDNLAVSILIPKLHLQLLKLLKSLMITLRTHLKVHSQYILEMLLHTLSWTSLKNSCGVKKPFAKLREKTYEVLSLWCLVMQNGSCCEVIAEPVITEILNDISPYRNEFTLKVMSGARKHMSKKARRQLNKAQNENSHLAQIHSSDNSVRKENLSDIGNQALCIAALQCLKRILFSASTFLKAPLLKVVQDKIIEIAAQFYEFPFKSDQLYGNADCRLEIFKVLHMILMTPHHLCPPPGPIIVKILQVAVTCEDHEHVCNQCGLLLLDVEKLVHPQREGLMFPIEHRDVRNTFIKMGKEFLLNQNNIFKPNEDEIDIETEQEQTDNTEMFAGLEDDQTKVYDTGNAKDHVNNLTASAISDTTLNVTAEIEECSNSILSAPAAEISTTPQSPTYGSICQDSMDVDNSERESTQTDNLQTVKAIEVQTENTKCTDDVVIDETLEPPSRKRVKQNNESNEKQHADIVVKGEGDGNNDDDALLADLESCFVDELI